MGRANRISIPKRHPFLVALLMILIFTLIGCTTIVPKRETDPSLLPTQEFSHELFDNIVKQYVDTEGRVDYASLKKNPDDLEQYYWLVTTYSPDSHPQFFPDQNHRLAYWFNAYNAGAIKTVLRHYPISSVLDVKQPFIFFFLGNKSGFFFFQRLTFGGKTTSLYYLENKVIRKRFKDPRIHFALNCASKGCPRLPQEAFSGARLDQQLEREAHRFISESRNFTIDHASKTIYVSEIFKWYEKDFTQWYQRQYPDRAADLLSYIALYLPTEKAAALQLVRSTYTLRFTNYDWKLNE